jgi:hypothetical protein
MKQNAKTTKRLLFGLGLVLMVGAIAIYTSSEQFRPKASTIASQLGFGSSSGQCEMKRVGKEANARIYVQNGLAYDGSVNLSPSWHPAIYKVQSDESLEQLTNQLCFGIISPPAVMTDMYRFFNKMVYNGAVRTTVAPGDRFRIQIDGQPYCSTTDFVIPENFAATKKNQIRDIIVAPEELKSIVGLKPGEAAPKLSEPIYIPIDYAQCNRYERDLVAREYTGVVTSTITKPGVRAAYPFTFSIDDEDNNTQGGGGNYLISTLIGTTTEHDLKLERQLQKIVDEHPTYCPQTGCGPTYYVTLKGKLGPEIMVGNQTNITQRYFQLESIVAQDVKDYTELHSGKLVLEPFPSTLLGTKYRLVDNVYPQPFQPLHYIIPKNTEIDNRLKALVGKEVSVTGRRSSHGMPHLDVTDVTTAMSSQSR